MVASPCIVVGIGGDGWNGICKHRWTQGVASSIHREVFVLGIKVAVYGHQQEEAGEKTKKRELGLEHRYIHNNNILQRRLLKRKASDGIDYTTSYTLWYLPKVCIAKTESEL